MKGALFGRLFPPPAPALARLPEAVLKAVLCGALAGPPIALALGWLMHVPLRTELSHPVMWLLTSALIGAIFSVSFYVCTALPVGYVRLRLRNAPRRFATALTALTGFAGGVAGCVVSLGLIGLVSGGRVETILPLANVIAIDGFIAMLIALALGIWDRLRAEKALAAARAEAKVLQAQINPHFFFNTLNTISALIPLDPAAAQRTLGLLADMSRYAFSSVQTDTVPLAREIDFARTYLEIEKARFGNRLRFDLPDAASVEGLAIPALTLQPLIENAVRHGIAQRIEGGGVSVRVERNGVRFSLAVENDADTAEISECAFFRPGHALSNVRDRLRLAYGAKASIEAAAPRPDAVAVTIRAPIHP